MDEVSTDILVVGGGVAGAAAAASLRNSGLSVTVVEPRAAGHDMNRGDLLYPASLDVLDEWGVLPVLRERGVEFSVISVRHGERVLASVDFSRAGSVFPFGLCIDHGIIEDALLDFAKSGKVVVMRGFTLQEVVLGRDGVHGAIVVGGGKKVLVKSRLVIGADGRNSSVREAVGIKAGVVDYGVDWVVFNMPIVNGFFRDVRLYVKPPEFVSVQVLPGERLRVAVQVPSGSASGWISKSPSEKHDYLLSFSEDFRHVRPEFIEEHVYSLKSKDAPRYWAKRAVLVGDAAHETHPVGSQGMLLAVGDAYALARVIGDSLDNLESKLALYESLRRPVAERVIQHSDSLARLLASHWDVERLLVFLVEHFSLLQGIVSRELLVLESDAIPKAGGETETYK